MSFKVIKENILKTNDDIASGIRGSLKGCLMLNIISSPGSGKTSFLEAVGPRLKEAGISLAIVIGDCFTSRDAERIDRLSIPVVQINTGNACHIDAQLVKKALPEVTDKRLDLIIVENVGNLVCPAEFDIGEDTKIAFMSVTEGHDKPMKYPLLFQECKLVIINKMDLLSYTDFDVSKAEEDIRNIHPRIGLLKISCKTGEGLDGFITWVKDQINEKKEKDK